MHDQLFCSLFIPACFTSVCGKLFEIAKLNVWKLQDPRWSYVTSQLDNPVR